MTGQHAARGRVARGRRRLAESLAAPAGPTWEVLVWLQVAVALGWARASWHEFIAYGLGTGTAIFCARTIYAGLCGWLDARRWTRANPPIGDMPPVVAETVKMWLDNTSGRFTPTPPEGNHPK